MTGLRSFVKTAAAEAACLTGADRVLAALADPAGAPLVLGYHQVVEDCARSRGSIPAMLVSKRTLERQLDWVGRRFRFVTLDELGERLETDAGSARSLAAVTFDDGYRDVYEHAFPVLKRKGIPAAVFVVTDLVGTWRLQTHDRLHLALTHVLRRLGGMERLVRRLTAAGLRVPALERAAAAGRLDPFTALRLLLETLTAADLECALEALAAEAPDGTALPELRSLTWDMVGDMHRAGITIGSHTRSHVLLTHESRERVHEELRTSRLALEARLGAPVRHLAYPDGRFSPAVVAAAAAAGYRFAYTSCRHRDRRHPLLTVPRRLLWENSARDGAGEFSPTLMRCQVQGVFDLMSRCRQGH